MYGTVTVPVVGPPRTTVIVAAVPSVTVYAGARNCTTLAASTMGSSALVRAPIVGPAAGFANCRLTVRSPAAPAGKIGIETILVVSPAAKTSVVTVAV